MPESRRGRLKILLGYAAGVGKTYQMLEEAQALKRAGVDVVIGYFEPHGRKDTIAKAAGLEMIRRRKIQYRGVVFEEMDTDAILRRVPQLCVIDELAHSNVPGSERAKRWEDVQLILDAGIDVLTNLNVQHLESLNDQVWEMTGVRVRETVPDWLLKQADEVVMVDVTPRALIHRMERGAVYVSEKALQALQNFFKESTLVALRELALRQTALEIEARQDDVTARGRPERLLICLTANPSTAALIRRARRVADYLQADCFAVTVHPDAELNNLPAAQREAVERHLNFARNLHIETRILIGQDVARTTVDFARLHQVTQIFVARAQETGRFPLLGRNLIQKIVRLASDMQVTIVADRQRSR